MGHQFFILAVCFSLLGCSLESTRDRELQKFADAFCKANQARNIQPMLELYELEGATEQTVDMLKYALLYELNMPIKSIEFEALKGSPEEKIRYEYKGIQYGPTLAPKMRMRVRYETEDQFESLFTIGQNHTNQWRIISSRPLENDSGE